MIRHNLFRQMFLMTFLIYVNVALSQVKNNNNFYPIFKTRVYSPGVGKSLNKSAKELFLKAEEVFPELLPAEFFLLYCAVVGIGVDRKSGVDSIDNIVNAEKWPARRYVRAEVIQWLCTSPIAIPYINIQGINISGIYIKGALDLSKKIVPFPLKICNSYFPDTIDLCFAQLFLLNLDGSRISCIYADGLQVDHTVSLSHNFMAEGSVRLIQSSIGNNIECINANFINKNGNTLILDGSNISGNIYLIDNFNSEGCISIEGTTIGGNIEFNGIFNNPNNTAINVGGSQVDGSISLGDGFRANGEVDLTNTIIGKRLVCINSIIENPTGYTLVLDESNIKGGLFLARGFKSIGELRLVNSEISFIQCINGTFSNPKNVAFNAQGMHANSIGFLDTIFGEGRFNFFGIVVEGTFFWKGFQCPENIKLDLRSARLNMLCDDTISFPKQNNLRINGVVYNQIDFDGPIDVQRRLKWIHLQPPKNFSTQPYEHLARIYEANGNAYEAKIVRITMEKDRERFGKVQFIYLPFHWLFGLLAGYGHLPIRLIFLMCLIILFGVYIFHKAYKGNMMIKLQGDTNGSISTYPTFVSYMYSIDLFVPIINFAQVSFWHPKGKYLYWYWFQRSTGWATSTILMLSLGGYFK